MMRTTDVTPIVNTKMIWHSISRLVWDSDLAASRFILAIAEMFWAIILFVPGTTFPQGVFPSLGFLPDYIWGLVFLFSCIVQISIILYEHMGAKFAKTFALFNAFLWVYLVLSIIIDSYPPIIGVAGEITLMLIAIWICIRPYILAEGLYRAGIR
jgi:hypothetical protein